MLYEKKIQCLIIPIRVFLLQGTNEILRLLIALTGLQHAGRELRDVVRCVSNSFINSLDWVKTCIVSQFLWDRPYKRTTNVW